MDDQQWPCPTCGEHRQFVQPPCVDGHTEGGGECPEWACADCGTAIFVGDVVLIGAAMPERRAA